MTKAQRADLASTSEKEAFRATYASKFRERSLEMDNRKKPSPRHRVVKDDAEDLVAVGAKNMAQEEASKIRADLRIVLTDGVRVLHVRYLQEDQMKLVTPRHQEQALKYQIIALGYTIKNGYSTLSMQVRREIDEENCAWRNSHCASRALRRALKCNIGRSVSLYYENLLVEVKEMFPAVLTDEGQAEFDVEYGVRAEKETVH